MTIHNPITDTLMPRLRHHMPSKLRSWFTGIATVAVVVVGCLACQDPAEPDDSLVPSDQVFWSLRINHKAVNLAIVQPYDTIQLSAVPRNVYGDVLPDASPATFAPSADLAIVISPDGLVRARSQTSTTGLRAIATLTYRGITRTDTAFIVVTNTPSPPKIKTFSLGPLPGDSLTISRGTVLDRRMKRLVITAQDTNTTTIPRVIAFFESSDLGVAVVNRQTGQATIQPQSGPVVIRASAMVYGVEKTDSISYTVTDPLLGEIILKASRPESEVTILRGGDVLWINGTSDSLDLVFDDSLAAQRPVGSTPLGLAYRDVGGNIAPFAGNTVLVFGALDPQIVRMRTFPLPGVYQYTSKRNPKFRGTIHVQ